MIRYLRYLRHSSSITATTTLSPIAPVLLTPLTTSNITDTSLYYHVQVSPNINFVMRVVFFLFFLVMVNTLIDAADMKKKYAKQYKKNKEKVGRWSSIHRVWKSKKSWSLVVDSLKKQKNWGIHRDDSCFLISYFSFSSSNKTFNTYNLSNPTIHSLKFIQTTTWCYNILYVSCLWCWKFISWSNEILRRWWSRSK